METREIYNISIQELLTTSFCVEWSLDNQISLITPRGVHILELQPNTLCSNPVAKFKRSFIYPSNHSPCQPFTSVTNSLVNNFNREDLYSAMLEKALTPKLPDRDDIIPRIVSVCWSPIKLIKPSKCLLAVVTSAGAIDLALKVGKNWYSICNLSIIWWDIVKDELKFDPENIDVNSLDAKTFRNNLRKLQGTAVTWSELYDNDTIPFSYFVTAYRNGELAVWKIVSIPEFPTELKPTLISRTQFDIQIKITKLLWIKLDIEKYLIIIGFFDGRICCLNEIASKKYITSTADNIPVNYMKELSRTDNKINLVVIKNFFFVVLTINYEGKLLNEIYMQLPGFAITGFLVINDSTTIVTTQDAKMYSIKFDETHRLISESVICDIKTSKVQFLGLARAPSGATFINITCPSGLHDHLINREPSTLQMFGFKGETWNPWNILNSNNYCVDNANWDCLETIRIRASKETDPENYLPSIPKTLEQLSIHELRNIMWLTLITKVLKRKKVIKKIDNVMGEISEAQPLIFVHFGSLHIIRLAKKKVLSDDMRLCIHFLRLYLEVFLAGEDDDDNNESNIIVKRAKDALNATKNLDLIRVELCNLCNKVVTELPWNTPCCPDGHQLPRCALTLLQITCLKYRSCPICARMYHPSLDEEYEDVKCLFCNVSAVYDNRIIGINDELEKTCDNLSNQPTWEMQSNKPQDIETSAVNEKVNKKRRTAMSNTFKLVVNNENEIITETWQEL